MNTSLTILLPVHNAQQRLETAVVEILDVLPELTSRFDLLIIDDGSTDDTVEVADELARRYPQVGVVRHPIRLGLAEAIQTGLDHTDGEIVFVGDEHYGLAADDLRKLWQLRNDRDLVLARQGGSPAPSGTSWIEKLLAWKPDRQRAKPAAAPALQMIRREAWEELRLVQTTAPAALNRRVDSAAPRAPGKPARPNYLDKVKRFALGE